MSLAISIPLALGRFRRLPQRKGEVWQGAIVRLPAWVDNPTDPDGPPFRPTGALWVSKRTGLINLDVAQEGEEANAELALAAFLEFGLKWAKGLEGRPSRVEVRDPGLRDMLARPLATLDTEVTVVDDLPDVREALHNFEEDTTGERPPGLLESPGVSIERVRAFADAAAAFFVARPWDHLANDDLVVVESANAPRNMCHVSLLGQAGEQFGLAFFDSRRAFERLLEATDTGRSVSRAHGVTFGTIDELPFADADAWQDHALPVAASDAYPLAAELKRDETMRRPNARELTFSEALLRAFAETTEDELDAGTWQKRVATFDGPVELTLSLPFLVEANTGQLPARELTPLERAQELAYDAMQANGRLRIKLARQALALSADCADAWVVLAEHASTTEAAVEHYERAVLAGETAIGADRFATLRGEFWEHLETRPYMRARLGLAQAVMDLGREDEALAHYRALLELNPGDDQGVRYILLVALLQRGMNDEAGALLSRHESDIQALWPFCRVLWQFRVAGDTSKTRAAYDAAISVNPYVVPYLLDPDSRPFESPPHFVLGSREEAVYVATTLFEAFADTEGALSWLAERARHSPARRPRARRRR